MKQSLIIALILGAQTMFSQPTIDGSNFTNGGDVLYFQNLSPTWAGSAISLSEISGEDEIWDATDWVGTIQSIEFYTPIDETPAVYQLFFNSDFLYPEHVSSHGQEIQITDLGLPLPFEVTDPFLFYKNDATGYYATGSAFTIEGLPLVTRNDSIERIYPFPMSFGTTDSSFISYLTEVPFLGAFGQWGTRTTEVDGWGELLTPFGNYEVLRLRTELSLTDTVYIEQTGTGETIERPLQIDYTWLSQDFPGPLLTISIVNGVVISAQILEGIGVLSLEEQNLSKIQIYPNPVKRFLHVKNTSGTGVRYLIYNMNGVQAKTGILDEDAIDLEGLSPGAYLIHISDSGENRVERFILTE